jgi:hypothetical protein
VTTAARTVIDLSNRVAPAHLETVIDDLVRRRALDLGHFVTRLTLPAGLGRAPVTALRQSCAARQRDPRRGASVPEDWVWDTIARSGLPVPVRHHPVWVGGRWLELTSPTPTPGWPWSTTAPSSTGTSGGSTATAGGPADLAVDGWLLVSVTSQWSEEDLITRLAAALHQRLSQRGLH